MRLKVVFYCTDRGNEPVRDWLKELGKPDSVLIGSDIRTVEYGWPIGMPVCRSLASGLWEVRTHLDGNRIARVLFCIENGIMYLLHGFIKKTRETPLKEMELALSRKSKLGV